MNLIALDFWTLLWIFLGLAIIGATHRLVWALGIMSDNAIGFLAHLGLKSVAKFLLIILVDYDQQTYAKSRFHALESSAVSVRTSMDMHNCHSCFTMHSQGGANNFVSGTTLCIDCYCLPWLPVCTVLDCPA
jgi:hypothetical protein